MTSDPVSTLVKLLEADADISATVNGRVFGIELPREAAKDMPNHAIIVRPSGGTPVIGGYTKHTTSRCDVICIGSTPNDANRLSNLVQAAFKAVRRQLVQTGDGGVLVHWINEAGGRLSGADPRTRWPVQSQAFQLFYAMETAA